MSAINFSKAIVDFSPSLKPFAFKLTQDLEEANDLIQETVYKALVNKDKFREGTNLNAWLYTIMKNIFINGYRKKSKRKTIFDSTDNLYYINSAALGIELNRSEATFIMDDIKKSIKELNKDFRIPFMLHFQGFKYQEIAEKLNLPLGTIKSRIFFARKELKKSLEVYKDNKNSGSKS